MMRKDALIENLMHKVIETPLLISQVMNIFWTQSNIESITIGDHQDKNPQLESHVDNQIFY